MYTTWEEWLDAPPIPLGQIAPLIICGPHFESCEFTRAGVCAVQMRGLPILEQWTNLRDSGLCVGIENARAVDRLNKLMGLDPLTLVRGGNITLEKFVEWAQSKRSITLPQELLNVLNRNIPPQPFERVRIAMTDAISFAELQKRWPSISYGDFLDEIENGIHSGFPRPFGVLQKLKEPSTGDIFYQCEYIPPGTAIRPLGVQNSMGYSIGYSQAPLEQQRRERLERWKGGFVYFFEDIQAYEADNHGLSFVPVDDHLDANSIFTNDTDYASLVEDTALPYLVNDGDSTMVRQYEYDIALSFAGEDRAYVDAVANILKSKCIKVFYDLHEKAALWGKDLYEYLSDVYKNKARFTVMFVSAKYADKLWTKHERKAAQARAFEENGEYILPARFDETEIPGIHKTIGYVDLNDHSPTEFAELIMEKLVLDGCTIPTDTIRRNYFSTTFTPQADPLSLELNVKCGDTPVEECTVVAIADNGTYLSARTNELGIAKISVNTRRMYDLLVAHPQYPASIIEQIDPAKDINISLQKQENIGSLIIHSTGYIPILSGRLNPILDTSNRMYLYADNIAVDGGKEQPVAFKIDVPLELEDASGKSCLATFKFIKARTSLLQYLHRNTIK